MFDYRRTDEPENYLFKAPRFPRDTSLPIHNTPHQRAHNNNRRLRRQPSDILNRMPQENHKTNQKITSAYMERVQELNRAKLGQEQLIY